MKDKLKAIVYCRNAVENEIALFGKSRKPLHKESTVDYDFDIAR